MGFQVTTKLRKVQESMGFTRAFHVTQGTGKGQTRFVMEQQAETVDVVAFRDQLVQALAAAEAACTISEIAMKWNTDTGDLYLTATLKSGPRQVREPKVKVPKVKAPKKEGDPIVITSSETAESVAPKSKAKKSKRTKVQAVEPDQGVLVVEPEASALVSAANIDIGRRLSNVGPKAPEFTIEDMQREMLDAELAKGDDPELEAIFANEPVITS